MRQLSLLCMVLSVLVSSSMAYGFGGCGQDCSECHSISPSVAETALRPLMPDVSVEQVGMAPAKGLWEVVFKSRGKRNVAYLDFALQNIIVGQIVQIQTKNNLTFERLTEVNKVDVAQIPLENSLVLGNSNAKHKIIVFSDPDCPFCGKFHQEMKALVETRRDIAFYIKLFPLEAHKDARRKSESIMCNRSMEMLEDAFKKKPIPDPTCKSDVVASTIALGKKLGITGTPSTILPDGRLIPGYVESQKLLTLLDKKSL